MDKNDNSKLKKLKVFFIGSQETGYEALESLIGSNVSIVGCFSLKPAQHETWEKDVSSLAQKNEISVWEFEDHLTQSKNPNNINDPKYTKIISDFKPDLIFVLGWRQIIGKKIRDIPRLGVIGIHFSLLPKLRGHAPVSWSIITNQEYTGLTLFYFEAGADTGDIIIQKETKIKTKDTALTLRKRLISLTKDAIIEIVPYLKKGNIPSKKQNDLDASLAAYRLPGHGEIDWSKISLEIYNEIRSTTHPYPGAFTFYKGEKVIIWGASLLSENPKHVGAPGQVIIKNKDGLTVVTGDNAILIKTLEQGDQGETSAENHIISTRESFGYNAYDEISKLREEISDLRALIKDNHKFF